MTVYLVYTEYQNGDPAIVGIFATDALAEAARQKEILTQLNDLHNQVYLVNEDGEEDLEQQEWDVDVHIDAYPVIGLEPVQTDEDAAHSREAR